MTTYIRTFDPQGTYNTEHVAFVINETHENVILIIRRVFGGGALWDKFPDKTYNISGNMAEAVSRYVRENRGEYWWLFNKSNYGKSNQRIYLIENVLTGNIKIGISDDCQKRLRSLQTGSDCELRLLCEFITPSSPPSKIEALLHKEFKRKSVRGEWFSVEENDVIEAIKRMNGVQVMNEMGL